MLFLIKLRWPKKKNFYNRVLFRFKQNFQNFQQQVVIWLNAYWLSQVGPDGKIFGSRSGGTNLEPNIFPFGPPTQSISTSRYFGGIAFARGVTWRPREEFSFTEYAHWILSEAISEGKTRPRYKLRWVRQRINLKIALDTRNVFLDLASLYVFYKCANHP